MLKINDVLEIPSLKNKKVFLVITDEKNFTQFMRARFGGSTIVVSLQAEEQALVRTLMRIYQDKAELEKFVAIDPVTGLLNRNFFLQELEKAMSLTQRTRKPCLLMVGEVDFDKDHPAVIAIVRSAAEVLKMNIRKIDVLAHLELGKFGFILNSTNYSQGSIVAKRLQQKLKEKVGMGIKLGMAVYMGEMHVTKDEFLNRAEEALRFVKKTEGESVYYFVEQFI